MDCRHTILVNTKWFYLKIRTDGDYNYKSQISLREWLTPSRYEIALWRIGGNGGYRWFINKSKSIWG